MTATAFETEADLDLDTEADEPAIRVDLQLIANLVRPRARVLDIGCGDGALLNYLVRFKEVDGRGMELSQAGVNACVAHGLSVIQGNANVDLEDYPSDSFDYVILSQTLQATRKPRHVLRHLVRIGRQAIVSFPNFGYWKVRRDLLLKGRMPVTSCLPEPWYRTKNIHLCTIKDFVELCRALEITIERSWLVDARGQARPIRSLKRANLVALQGLFLLRKD
jgi:methionine biosynthesis protein MetW